MKLDPRTEAHIPLEASHLDHLTITMADVMADGENRRAEADERRLDTAIELVEERARQREDTHSESWQKELLVKQKQLSCGIRRLRGKERSGLSG